MSEQVGYGFGLWPNKHNLFSLHPATPPSIQNTAKHFVMPCPPRNPHHHSNWWHCPVPGCSKWCKSKRGRVQHIRAKHPTYQPEPSNIEFHDFKDNLSPSPTQSSDSPSCNDVYPEDIEPINNFNVPSPIPSTFLNYASLVEDPNTMKFSMTWR